jgi:hypothetical protein
MIITAKCVVPPSTMGEKTSRKLRQINAILSVYCRKDNEGPEDNLSNLASNVKPF